MNNFIDIYIDEREKSVPAFCQLCGSVLQTLEDTMCSYKEGCCENCFIMFVQPNIALKGEDWKPNEEEKLAWLQKKDKQFSPMYRFF